jgi:mono/diheme cytochrome c family protein
VALIIGGVLVILYRRQLRWLPAAALKGATGGAVAAMIAGGVLAFGVDTHGAPADPSAGNPVEPTQASVARGMELFQQNCVTCHGVDGRGDGPTAPSLNPAPSDFRLHVPYHTDVELFKFIADGYPGTAMPAWRDEFSEEDIWNLVNFLRANFTEAPTE